MDYNRQARVWRGRSSSIILWERSFHFDFNFNFDLFVCRVDPAVDLLVYLFLLYEDALREAEIESDLTKSLMLKVVPPKKDYAKYIVQLCITNTDRCFLVSRAVF